MVAIVSYLLMLAIKIYQFKVKDSEIKDYTLCLGNISKDFTINNMKNRFKSGIFSVYFKPIDTNEIQNTHR